MEANQSKPIEAQDPQAPYEPTDREKAAIGQYDAKREARIPLVSMKHIGGEGNSPQISIDHEDPLTGTQLWALSLGTDDCRFADALVHQMAQLSLPGGKFNIDTLNKHLAFVQNIAPQNSLEAALATQMAAVHSAMMDMARRLASANNFQQVDIYERSMNKLARTFTTQMDTLKKFRSKNEQRVVVEHQHVHVYPGGQAVVGTVNHGGTGEGQSENEGHPHERTEQLRVSERQAVPGDIEADGLPVQGASGDGVERVPVSRGQRRATLRAVE